jgi:hypothetical protein
MLYEIKHRFTGTVLFSLETESFKLCVQAAVKAKACLRDAYLGGADLGGADLGDAIGVIYLGAPNGWHAHAWLCDGWLSIRVGCHEFRLAEAREYWQGKPDRREVMSALDYAETVAAIREWAVSEPAKQEAA